MTSDDGGVPEAGLLRVEGCWFSMGVPFPCRANAVQGVGPM